ncbi:variant erythrocyte surface antigen-1 family protein [Babesia caballi]|uniref:Variant erythrocyte surface antigen-1 family protein n=1 Tax=Babesia caballi TaxID=5871 RepID=A0AAV4LX15_BABCB|nr:variant erythrocyte surface antigen-1 family protein [Babesia caballi]
MFEVTTISSSAQLHTCAQLIAVATNSPPRIPFSRPCRPLFWLPSNLKEAIDWILRVTGKDTANGDDGGTAGLAAAVEKLLGTVVVGELESPITVTQSLIENLATGLATFIGYKDSNGLIGADGIAVSNEPLERLRDAVLGFLAGFLGTLNDKAYQNVLKLSTHSPQIVKVIAVLKGCVGKGQQGFRTAIGNVETQLQKVSVLGGGIKEVLNKVKNVSAIKSNQGTVSAFATQVMEYFKSVLDMVVKDNGFNGQAASAKNHIGTLKGHLQTLVGKVGEQKGNLPINVGKDTVGGQQGIGGDLEKVKYNNAYLQPSYLTPIRDPKAKALASAVYSATTSFRRELQKPLYTSSYLPSATWDGSQDKPKCAKIFLGCIPLYYYGITYLYWQCNQPKNKGGWAEWTFGQGSRGYELRYFMAAIGFDINQFNLNSGETVMNSVSSKLTELSSATGTGVSYPQFIAELHKKLIADIVSVTFTSSNFTRHTIAALIHCAATYFQCKKRQNINKPGEPPPPATIRAMLYWLSGLTITQQFGSLLGHFTSTVPDEFKVAVSGSSGGQTLQALTADDLSGHLIPACILCPNILGLIQGAGDSADSEPWLHGLFGNALNLSYPSGLGLFRALCDYVYAVQFQLSFLVQMCISGSVNGGWQNCRYGKDVQPNGPVEAVKSWICPIIYGCQNKQCQHNSSKSCKHIEQCGSNGKGSPLQAFLTDFLGGFCHSTSAPCPPARRITQTTTSATRRGSCATCQWGSRVKREEQTLLTDMRFFLSSESFLPPILTPSVNSAKNLYVSLSARLKRWATSLDSTGTFAARCLTNVRF